MLITKSFLCALVFLFYGFAFAESIKHSWKYSNDIHNPINWVDGRPQKDCKGVIFPNQLGSIASVYDLYAEEIILPHDGEIEIRQGGFIEIKEDSPCIRIKELTHHHWLDPDSWISEKNLATPDTERVPCIHDDVIFSRNSTVAVYYPEVSISVRSVEIGGISLTNEQWQDFVQTDYGSEQFYMLEYQGEISIRSTECKNNDGCFCHFGDDVTDWVCEYVGRSESAPCLDPVQPVGHCNDMCGGIVLLDVSHNFNFEDFKTKIPNHDEVDVYASKVLKSKKPYIQVVFVEKNDYKEVSTKIAKDFHSSIINDLRSYGINSATLQISGMFIPKGSRWGTAMSIVFGTLVTILFICVFIYILYVGPLENYNLSSRIPFREISFGNLRPFLFAKFENKEEGQMSMAASLVSLEKAFDNPMFGAHRPSTSSSAVVDVVLTEQQPTTSETIHKNPAFGEAKSKQVEIEDVEDVEE